MKNFPLLLGMNFKYLKKNVLGFCRSRLIEHLKDKFFKKVVKIQKNAALMSILFRKPECHSVNDSLHDIFSAEEDLMHLLFGTGV